MTAQPLVFLPGTLPPDAIVRLGEHFEIARTDDLSAGACARVRGIATRSMVGADRPLLSRFPNLEIVAVFGVGADAVDLAAARERGIIVTNTPDVLTEDTADYAMALVLALARRVVEGDRFVRAGKWRAGALPNSARVHGKRLGIVGLGRIGQALARRAAAFAMPIHWHGPRPKPELPYTYHPTIACLAEVVDFLVLTCPGGPQTRNLINAAVLERLGPAGFLINVARGSVVDEAAVIAALRERRIAGAALDVFADEPNVPDALLGLDNVIIEPHIASTTVETRHAIGELMVANLVAHFAGGPVPSPVTP